MPRSTPRSNRKDSEAGRQRALARLFDTTAPKLCPRCGALAVVPLPPFLLAQQPDTTTHVCLPIAPWNGCNHGFGPTTE